MSTYDVASSIFYNGDGSRGSTTDFTSTFNAPELADGFINIDDPNFNFGVYLFDGSFQANGHFFLVYTFDTTGATFIYSPTAASTNPGYPATYTPGSITLDTTPVPLCFAAGSLIRTVDGDVAVEDLEAGQMLKTAGGGQTRVIWVGTQTLRTAFADPRLRPVRISADAFGPGLPYRDLTVTADHAMVLDGLLINAGALVNGQSIQWVPAAELGDGLTVYHVETEAHDVLYANGAETESFIDYASRRTFDNYDGYLAATGGVERMIPEMPLPRISTARLVPGALRARLNLDTAEVA